MVVTPTTLREWPLPGSSDAGSDKERRGRLLVAGGSATTPGAVRLAGEAALRSGAGKLRLATVESAAPALAVAVPEAAVHGLPVSDDGFLAASAANELRREAAQVDAVLLGPGMKDPPSVVALLAEVVPHLEAGLVLDALASAYVTAHPDGLPPGAVLTVNPDELEHTGLGDPAQTAARTGAVVLLGGTDKHVAAPDGRRWTIAGGGAGLGSSGSGDVQAGIVAGLLARGADPAQAAVCGAYLHARAGEELATAVGDLGFLARELLPVLPRLLEQLR